jgi:D-aminoacyl-tRNA deacylase
LKAADAAPDADMIISKVLSARVFHDSETGKNWASSVSDIGGELLFVSQFTLYGRLKSKSPDFTRSMKATEVC